MKKTLLAGASALALVAVSGGAFAEHDPNATCVGVDNCNTGESMEANNNPGAVAQNDSEALVVNGDGATAYDDSDAEAYFGLGTTAQGEDSVAADGTGNFSYDGDPIQAGDGGNAIEAEDGSTTAVAGSLAVEAEEGGLVATGESTIVKAEDIDALASDGGVAWTDVAVGGADSLVIEDNDEGAIATGQAAALRNEEGSFTALNDSTGVLADDVEALAVNGSTAVENGAFVGGDGVAIGEDAEGAVATGGGFAVGEAAMSYNDVVEQVALSDVELEQELDDVAMFAEGGEIDGGSSGAGGGGSLTTGGISASIAMNTGITTANFNTGIANQGAAVSIGAVASF